jgi:hypothetical protein
VAASHLVGAGNVKQWLATNGATAPADGSGTKMTEYLQRFAGYSLNAVPPSYASVRAATPTGGTGKIVTPSSPYVTTAPLVDAAPLMGSGGTGPSYTTAADGFHGATGYNMDEVRNLIVLLVAALVVLWYARTLTSSWQGYSGGTLSIFDLKSNVVQGAVVVMLLIYLIH